ncbi:MAG: tandem-95 repeat protein [Lentisphaeraceae bacterium]|nr:tandem-95 repeat protein [Lentisphaeraceae bacterium]
MMTDIRDRDGANHWAWRDYDFEKAMKIPALGGYKSIIDGGGYYEADSRNGFWNLIMWDHGNDIFHAVVLKAHADEVNYADYNESTSWMMKHLSLEAGRDFSAWFEWASFTLTQADKDAVAHLPSWIPVHGSVLTSTTAVNIPVVIDLTSTAHSSDGIVTLLSSTNPRSASLVDNGDGTVTYTPNGAFEGYDAFRYTLKSSTGDTGTQEVVLTVGAPTVANKEPQAIKDIVSTNENTSVTLAVMSNDSDPDADILELTEVRQPMYGQTTLNGDGTLTYTPNDGFSGKDEFMYVVVDGRGGIDRATVFVTVNNTVNQAPNFSASSLSKANALTTKMYLAEVRSDAIDLDNNDKLSFTKVSGPAWMNVTSQGSITGIPTSADLGLNSLTVRVSDGTLSSETTVEVIVENQTGAGSLAPPTFNSSIISNLSATEDAPFSGFIGNSANDSDGNLLTYKKAAGAQWLQIAADGTLSGTPDNEVVGVNTFYVEVSDSISGTDIAILTVDVANTNDTPTSKQTVINETMIAKTPYQKSIAPLIEDDDIGETFTYSKFSGPAWLSVNPDGTLSGVPTGNDTSGNTFVIRVTDSAGAYVDITLTLENYSGSSIVEYWDGIAGPAISDLTDNVNYPDSPGTTTTLTSGFELPSNRARDYGVRVRAFITPVVSGDYTFWIASDDSSDLNFSDYGRIAYVDGWSDEKSWDSKSSQKSAVMSLIAGQSYYMEVLMKAGGGGDHCAVAWQAPGGVREVIPMSVLVQNYYPDVTNDTAIVTEGASVVISVLANDSDDNGDVLAIASVTQGSNGSVVINGTSVTYTPNANFSGADSFTYVASDGQGGSRPSTVNITVANINNTPTAAADFYTITERSALLNVLTNDVDLDGDSLTVQSVTPAANGTVSFSPSSVTYNVDADFTGNDSFTYTITDGNGGNATATVLVEIHLPSGTGSGSVISHLWTDISGNLISTMTDLATYPNEPNSKAPLTSLEGASIGDSYGQLIRGYIHPPITADYTFKSNSKKTSN